MSKLNDTLNQSILQTFENLEKLLRANIDNQFLQFSAKLEKDCEAIVDKKIISIIHEQENNLFESHRKRGLTVESLDSIAQSNNKLLNV